MSYFLYSSTLDLQLMRIFILVPMVLITVNGTTCIHLGSNVLARKISFKILWAITKEFVTVITPGYVFAVLHYVYQKQIFWVLVFLKIHFSIWVLEL